MIQNIDCEISEGFFSFKGHYFGLLNFLPDQIIFEGNRRGFKLNKIPLTIQIPLKEVHSIVFEYSRIIKVYTNTKRYIFMIGESTITEYGSATAAQMAASGAGGNIQSSYEVVRSKSNETLLDRIYMELVGTPSYTSLEIHKPSGVKVSHLNAIYLVLRVLIPAIAVIIMFWLFSR